MGLFDGIRKGRDEAIENRRTAVRLWREGCRVHGSRYAGCPLDLIERETPAGAQAERPGRRGERLSDRKRRDE
jgi:hypothetical protein